MVNADSVIETRAMESESVHLILTSIPFSTQYEYSPNYADFGHTDSNEHFWKQMQFLIPELHRILQPGRIACIHVKDRIIPSGIAGRGFQEVYPFHVDAIQQFTKHGFGYLGMKTIVTDVVRENNQTYRLGWTEQCKDGTKMGVGMPEYLLIFRKPPTDTADSYADDPVIKFKPDCITEDGEVVPFNRDLPIEFPVRRGFYSRMRWQVDAHGFARSSGQRLLTPEEIKNLEHDQIFQLFKKHSLENVYDYEQHVRLGESMEADMRLPVTFMLMQPQSWSDEVWADVTRMMTLNSSQAQRNQEQHLCPMQFDIADRAITQYTQPGETVFDPFAGIGSVPYRALLMKRKGIGIELSKTYWLDGLGYLKMAENKINTPTLFDLEADLVEQ
jgi:DNA modification methylase